MQIVIAGKDPTSLEEYLTEHGHTVKCFYVNDLCLDIARAYNPDVFIYMDDVFDKVPHEQALRSLKDYRLLIVTVKENSFIPYAAALGIKDFVFQPCELSAILHRIENPATKEDAAEMLRHIPNIEVKHHARELVSERSPAKPKHHQRFWRSKGSQEAIPGSLKENRELMDDVPDSILDIPKKISEKESSFPDKLESQGVNLGKQQLLPVNKSTKHSAKNTTSKKANLLILDNVTLLTDYKGYIVDAVGEISHQIEASKPIWRADWRLGVNARPLRINGVYLFAQSEFLGPLDELDQIRFVEFVEMLLEKNKKVYVIDSGRWSEELLRMGAVIMEGGF